MAYSPKITAQSFTFQIIQECLNIIFSHEQERILEAKSSLVKEMKATGKVTGNATMYGGAAFNEKGITTQQRFPFPVAFSEQAEAIVADEKRLTQDRLVVNQILTLACMGCKTSEDFRDALPEILVDNLPNLRQLPRNRPEAFLLAGQEQKLEQYKKLRDILDFYMVSKLIY